MIRVIRVWGSEPKHAKLLCPLSPQWNEPQNDLFKATDYLKLDFFIMMCQHLGSSPNWLIKPNFRWIRDVGLEMFDSRDSRSAPEDLSILGGSEHTKDYRFFCALNVSLKGDRHCGSSLRIVWEWSLLWTGSEGVWLHIVESTNLRDVAVHKEQDLSNKTLLSDFYEVVH